MAKNSNEKLISSVLPVNETTWLVQPITVTVSKFDYDTTQTKFLVAIIEGLQESIKQSITREVAQLPLFSDGLNENELKMEIPLKTLGVDPRRYGEIKQSLIKLATTPFEMPVKDEAGKSYNRYSGLCEVYIPDEKYVRSVIVKIKKDVALSLIDAKVNGYQKYLKQVVTKTKNKYTQRLYFFITAWKTKGETTIKISTLRSILQLENKYPRWNSFYTNVIKSAETELKENFEAGVSECYFISELVYLKGKEWGEPDMLRFIVKVSDKEKENMMNQSYYSLKLQTDEKLRTVFKVKTKRKREQLLRLVTEDNIRPFMEYLIKFEGTVEKQQHLITDMESYTYTSCMRYLKKEIPEAEIVETILESDIKGTEELYQKEISAFNKAILKEIGDSAYQTWITPIRFVEVKRVGDCMEIMMEVPTKFFYETIEQKYITHIANSLKKCFKRNISSIKYRVKN